MLLKTVWTCSLSGDPWQARTWLALGLDPPAELGWIVSSRGLEGGGKFGQLSDGFSV